VRKLLTGSAYIWFAALAAVLVVVIAVTTFSNDTPAAKPFCGLYRADKLVRVSSETINAEVVLTPKQRETGLSGRPCILANQGMLFNFGRAGQYPIWMKGMNFPIDIVWIGPDHKVVGLESGVKPSTYPDSFVNKKEGLAQYVLELKANRSTDLHITIGTPIQF